MRLRSREDRSRMRAYARGNWVMLPRPFIRMLPMTGALMLAFLIDAGYRFLGSDKTFCPKGINKADGWFLCSIDDVCAELSVSHNTQATWFAYLKNHGYIKVKLSGVPPRRFVRINWRAIEDRMDEIESE